MLARALGDAAENAFAAGNASLGHRLTDIIGAMAPFDAALDARLRAQIEPWLATAAIEVPGPAAGNDEQWGCMSCVAAIPQGYRARLTGNGLNWPALLENHNRRVELGLVPQDRQCR